MYGAILGDIIGAPYEFGMGDKSKCFPLFSEESRFTDDTVMTIAVAEALMEVNTDMPDEKIKDIIIDSLKKWGRKYPSAGYGERFGLWLYFDDRNPYNSFGNGSAMRVSSAAWLFDDIETVRRMARLSAEVTHNHPEGIKGAEATACAIFMARKGENKKNIKCYVENEFGYDLSRKLDDIRPYYRHIESCMQTVPEAIISFLEGESFEDTVRNAVSLGGDADTLAAIAGSIAEGYFGIEENLKDECKKRLDKELGSVLDKFEEKIKGDE